MKISFAPAYPYISQIKSFPSNCASSIIQKTHSLAVRVQAVALWVIHLFEFFYYAPRVVWADNSDYAFSFLPQSLDSEDLPLSEKIRIFKNGKRLESILRALKGSALSSLVPVLALNIAANPNAHHLENALVFAYQRLDGYLTRAGLPRNQPHFEKMLQDIILSGDQALAKLNYYARNPDIFYILTQTWTENPPGRRPFASLPLIQKAFSNLDLMGFDKFFQTSYIQALKRLLSLKSQGAQDVVTFMTLMRIQVENIIGNDAKLVMLDGNIRHWNHQNEAIQNLQIIGLQGFQRLMQNDRPPAGIDVHEGQRDHLTIQALMQLYRTQGMISVEDIESAYQSVCEHVETLPEAQREKALRALNRPRIDGAIFGPLVSDIPFTIHGREFNGKELIARIWRFACSIADEREQSNAKAGIVGALIDSISQDGHVVCNQGKTQRLVVSVLQGRLAGINIEGHELGALSVADAMTMFFSLESRREIRTLGRLLEEAGRFCDENPNVIRDDFINEIRRYAEESEIRELDEIPTES